VRYAFGEWVLDILRRELRRGDRPVALEPQVFDVLAYLVEHHDRVVSKDELFDRIWGHRFVSDAALITRIMAARKAVGDDGRAQRLIKTVHGHGYRFSGEIEPVATGDALPAGGAVSAAALPRTVEPWPASGAITITFLVAEPEDSVGLAQADPPAYRAALTRHQALLRDAVRVGGGEVFEAVGNGVAAAFADPTPAVAAALAGQLALRGEDWRAVGMPGLLRSRMALHTGTAAAVPAPASASEADAPGPAGVPAAAGARSRTVPGGLSRCVRLAAVAYGGQVVLSEATAALVRDALPDGTDLLDLGAHRLEEGARPERLYQLVPPQITGTFPAPRGVVARAHNLPRALTSFVGREGEAVEVRALLATTPLVTLTGPGGSGKTRLALRVAADVKAAAGAAGGAGPGGHARSPSPDAPDGVWFVDLAPVADGALIPRAVAAAVGVREVPGQPLPAILAGALRQRALLLVLDNCEHLVDACAHLVETLLRAAPRLRVLTTSREPLRAAGEAVYRVPPLAAPDAAGDESAERVAVYPAVRLFVERARSVQPAFRLTAANAAAVAQVCRRLDGLPLAIELAAARIRVLSPAQLVARLDDRFALLTGGDRTAVRRQQTLRASLDWSYELLTGAERTLLRRLAVFAGGCTLEAAEAVGNDEAAGFAVREGEAVGTADVLDLLTSVVDKSLVVVEEEPGPDPALPAAAGDDPPGSLRYRSPETVRRYALERLDASGEAGRARAAHARFFLDLAERAAPELGGRRQAGWHARLETEHDNLRAALTWSVQTGDAERALRLVAALHWFWYRRRYWEEGYAWPARVLALPGAQEPTPLRARVLESAALFAMWREPAAALAMWEESVAINRRHGRLSRTAQTHTFQAWLLVRLGRLNEAHARAAAALSLAESAADGDGCANALALLAAVAARRGEHAAAREHHEAALALRRASGDVSARSLLLLDTAKAAFLAGEDALARARGEEALRTAREAGIRQAVEEELRLIARVALAQGDLATATARAAELVVHARGQGTGAEVDALALLAQVNHAAGDAARAAARYAEVLELAQRLPDPGEARPLLFRDTGDQPGVALALEGTAALIAPSEPALALRLGGAAAALRERARQPLTPAERAALDARLAGARRRLGADEADRAWSAGRDAAIEETLSLALAALATLPPAAERRAPAPRAVGRGVPAIAGTPRAV
jgi:predicted ATPase/DNA-binding winged helix-turn-helix (wHTH) protein